MRCFIRSVDLYDDDNDKILTFCEIVVGIFDEFALFYDEIKNEVIFS